MAMPAFSPSEPVSMPRNEVSVQALGSWVKSTSDNGVQNSATDSGGVRILYRFFFNEHSGVEANYGYSLNTENYGLSEGPLGVKSYSHEAPPPTSSARQCGTSRRLPWPAWAHWF